MIFGCENTYNELQRVRYESYGNEIMYNGLTGEQSETLPDKFQLQAFGRKLETRSETKKTDQWEAHQLMSNHRARKEIKLMMNDECVWIDCEC